MQIDEYKSRSRLVGLISLRCWCCEFARVRVCLKQGPGVSGIEKGGAGWFMDTSECARGVQGRSIWVPKRLYGWLSKHDGRQRRSALTN